VKFQPKLHQWVCSALGSILFLSAGIAWAMDAVPKDSNGSTPLFENLGNLHHPISTASPKAQQYFDQGLRLVFAFNHEEAINSFKEAARLDPKAAMPYWGIALALGPNINLPMSPEAGRQAYEAVQKAATLASNVTLEEWAYIEALTVRYSPTATPKREDLDAAYADAMAKVWTRYPKDSHAGTLYAEAMMNQQPWDYWTKDGQPKGHALEIIKTLEQVLRLNPNHPGACHYYIHAVEASQQPARALDCAKRLPSLAPGAGHLVHMPAHIYLRLGMYREAVERNAHASSVDHEYLAHRNLTGVYPIGYYPHNVHFLWAALSMEGRSQEALQTAHDLDGLISWETVVKEPTLEEFAPAALFTLVRFGKWEEALTIPKPPAELIYTTVVWHYARGLAYAATKKWDEARREKNALVTLAASTPADRLLGGTRVVDLAKIADLVVDGEIAARQGRYDQAIAGLQAATALEDQLRYYEPPLWHIPVRHSLGAVLLQAGRPAKAEQVYRADLQQHPHNGWALYGLKQSLDAQQKRMEAGVVDQEFRHAWARADVQLPASRF
jgi:tetratricopeptide (TPR) repeat protein